MQGAQLPKTANFLKCLVASAQPPPQNRAIRAFLCGLYLDGEPLTHIMIVSCALFVMFFTRRWLKTNNWGKIAHGLIGVLQLVR
jgi:hypothetical protein